MFYIIISTIVCFRGNESVNVFVDKMVMEKLNTKDNPCVEVRCLRRNVGLISFCRKMILIGLVVFINTFD